LFAANLIRVKPIGGRETETEEELCARIGVSTAEILQSEERLKKAKEQTIAEFPGLFAGLKENSLGIQVGSQIVWRRTAVNRDGTLPITGDVTRVADATAADFQASEQFLLRDSVNASSVEHDSSRTLEYLKSEGIPLVQRTINGYRAGQRPTREDILKGRSITEPYLQVLAGGTPREGLALQASTVSDPDAVSVYPEQEPLELKGVRLREVTVLLADPEVLKAGRELAQRYYRLTSDILTQHPEIREVAETGKIEIDFECYAAAEWERKEEALQIAEELEGLLSRKVAYLENLRAKALEKLG